MAGDDKRDRLAAALRANLKRRKRPRSGGAPIDGEEEIAATSDASDRTAGPRH